MYLQVFEKWFYAGFNLAIFQAHYHSLSCFTFGKCCVVHVLELRYANFGAEVNESESSYFYGSMSDFR